MDSSDEDFLKKHRNVEFLQAKALGISARATPTIYKLASGQGPTYLKWKDFWHPSQPSNASAPSVRRGHGGAAECGGSGWHKGSWKSGSQRIALRRFLGHCDHFSFSFLCRTVGNAKMDMDFIFAPAMSWNLLVLINQASGQAYH